MDEILIEEKKYISSKRAAKVTGYAKDYIGQLCREGRVPARLVGRAWYVLESAIQDHRFGDSGIEPEKSIETTPLVGKQDRSTLPSTWEAPRYETQSEEILPSINMLIEESSEPVDSRKKELSSSQNAQDSWRAWFDRFDHIGDAIESPEEVPAAQEENEQNLEVIEEEAEKDDDTVVHIPIHTISRSVPTDLLPRHSEAKLPSNREREPAGHQVERRRNKMNKTMVTTVQIAGSLLAMTAVILAVIGSGYFDEYILSNSQVRIIAGVALYNK